MPALPRIQRVVLPILRAAPALAGVRIVTWVPDVDDRDYPMINVRRFGGPRHAKRPTKLGFPIIEMTAYGNVGLIETEDLYEDALEALYEAKRLQTLTEFGYLHSIKETLGTSQFSSLYQDSWRVQGLISLGLRPPRST